MRGDKVRDNFEGLEFQQIQGSNVWPSDDPKDSNCDIFICTCCKWQFKARIYGASRLNSRKMEDIDMFKAARHTMTLHKESRCEYLTHKEEKEPIFNVIIRGYAEVPIPSFSKEENPNE